MNYYFACAYSLQNSEAFKILSQLKYLNVSGKLLLFWAETMLRFIEIDYIIVFCSLLIVFLEIVKKSSKLFNVI